MLTLEIVYQLDVAETAPYISSLAWSKNGQYLSVGLSNGAIHVRVPCILAHAPISSWSIPADPMYP
jgi:hypothetical protein